MNLLRKYRVTALPLFEDNYSYVIQGTAPSKLVLVDPANPTVVLAYLKAAFPQHQVSHVLYTHKHWDHAGGAGELYQQLKQTNPEVSVIIGEKDRQFVEAATHSLLDGEEIKIGFSLIRTLHVPCHTRGHTIYNFQPLQVDNQAEQHIQVPQTIEGKKVAIYESSNCTFTGDTLFVGGIGRFFEGNAAQMVQNVKKMTNSIDEDSDIFVGHEYTLANLKWAKDVEKNNADINNWYNQLATQAQQIGPLNLRTIPSSLRKQKLINVFVRAVTGTPLHQTITQDQTELMKILRQMKNKNVITYQELIAKNSTL